MSITRTVKALTFALFRTPRRPSARRSMTLVLAPLMACVGLLSPSLTQAAPFAYVVSSGSNLVSVIDTATNAVVDSVDVGSPGYGIALSPDGSRAYVARPNAQVVSVIDTGTNSVVAEITFDSPQNYDVALSPDGAYGYVGVCAAWSAVSLLRRTRSTTIEVRILL